MQREQQQQALLTIGLLDTLGGQATDLNLSGLYSKELLKQVDIASATAAMPFPTEMDRSILNHAILNGALELLPQSWASMAIELGGLLGQLAGGLGTSVSRAGASMAFSFATTYALGQVARRYYAGGRQMSTALLQETFQSLLQPAKDLPQIRQRANGLDMGSVMSMVRGR